MVELQRLIGTRSGEVVKMRGGDLDMSSPLWPSSPSTHKTEHYDHLRAVALGLRAQEMMPPCFKTDLQRALSAKAVKSSTLRVTGSKRFEGLSESSAVGNDATA